MEKMQLRERYLKSKTALSTSAYLFSVLFSYLGSHFIQRVGFSYPHMVLLPIIAFFLPLLLYAQSEVGTVIGKEKKPFSTSYIPRLLLWLLGLLFGSAAVFLAFEKGLTVYGVPFSIGSDPFSFVSGALAFILLPSLFEELMLRGAWQGNAQEKCPLGAIIASALMTSVYGFDLVSCLYLLIGGVVFAVVKAQCGSTHATVWLALLWRGVLLTLLPLVGEWLLALPKRPLWIVLAAALALLCFFFAFKRERFAPSACARGYKLYLGFFSFFSVVLALLLAFLDSAWI